MKKLLILALMVTSLQLNAGEILVSIKDFIKITSIAYKLAPIPEADLHAGKKTCKCITACTVATCTLYFCGSKALCCAGTVAACGYAVSTGHSVISDQPNATTKKD